MASYNISGQGTLHFVIGADLLVTILDEGPRIVEGRGYPPRLYNVAWLVLANVIGYTRLVQVEFDSQYITVEGDEEYLHYDVSAGTVLNVAEVG